MGVILSLLTIREEHRLRVFENRVLRIFAPRDEVTGAPYRRIKSRRMRWAGH
jgi:hypothetical protein